MLVLLMENLRTDPRTEAARKMGTAVQAEKAKIAMEAHYASMGSGRPVVLIHGLAASLHDWDLLAPALVQAGYAAHAVDLLGHGGSPKPEAALYEMGWVMDHFAAWVEGLSLKEPAVLIGHSLGGYLALQYARRRPEGVRGLVLVDPFYSQDQLPVFLRWAYSHPALTAFVIGRTPLWLLRPAIYAWSATMGHRSGGLHALSREVRDQTAADYLRTAPAAYGILQAKPDLTPMLADVHARALVVWGTRDNTLRPRSFDELVRRLPNARGESTPTGHVPHLAESDWFNEQVLNFLRLLDGAGG